MGWGRCPGPGTSCSSFPLDGSRVQAITQDGASTIKTGPAWSPSGSELTFLSSRGGARPTLHRVTLGDQPEAVLAAWGVAFSCAWSTDGQRLLFIGRAHVKAGEGKLDVWSAAPSGKDVRCLTAELSTGVGQLLQADMPAFWQPQAQPRLLVSRNELIVQGQAGGCMRLYRVSTTASHPPEVIVGGNRTCVALGAARDRVLFADSTLVDPSNLAIVDLASGHETRLTHLNEDPARHFQRHRLEELHVTADDGVALEAWLLLPVSGRAPLPAILSVHGGPTAGYGHVFNFDFHLLADAGFAVLFVNQRGSTGYGSAFTAQVFDDLGGRDYRDLMCAVDHAVRLGFIDEGRLGVTGLSAGGLMTCWIVGQTNRFRAAVAENPITNFESFFGVSDIGPAWVRTFFSVRAGERPELLRQRSPITYAQQCRTPTLLVQVDGDLRCPPEQAEQFFVALKDAGCVCEMLRVPGTSHLETIYGAPEARRAQNDALIEWMTRYVLE